MPLNRRQIKDAIRAIRRSKTADPEVKDLAEALVQRRPDLGSGDEWRTLVDTVLALPPEQITEEDMEEVLRLLTEDESRLKPEA